MTDETQVPESETPDTAVAEVVPAKAHSAAAAQDVPPDRLAIDPRSPFCDGDKLRRGIGIRFKGTVRRNVEEYCISEGWVKVAAGKSKDRYGNPLTIKLKGKVEPFFKS
jgi:predicted house-cleaning NTP pyrophosphatase (Maf/HAM1 superfamily)